MAPLVERRYRFQLTFTEPLLGSQPTSNIAIAHVRRRQIDALARELRREGLSLAEAQAEAEARVRASEVALLDPEEPEAEAEGDEEPPLPVTGFAADARGLFLWDYQVKGHLKASAQTLRLRVASRRGQDAGASATRDLQSLLWVFGEDGRSKRLYLKREGRVVTEPDRLLPRPLRALTARGPRVSIAISEALDPPLTVAGTIVLLRGCRITREQLEELLAYGQYEGLGQWRSGGFGRHAYELIEL